MKKGALFLVFGILILCIFLIENVSANDITNCGTGSNGLRSLPSTGNHRIMNDFSCSGIFTPIASFSGTLDGQGHKITGLTISESNTEIGLFRTTSSATIKNLRLESISITSTGTKNIGALIGKSINTIVENSYVTGSITVTDNFDCYGSAGGLIGLLESTSTSVVKKTFVNVNVNANHDCRPWYAVACEYDWAAIGGFIGSVVSANILNTNIENS